MSKAAKAEQKPREGSLQRNNIYSSEAVRDWADRLPCGNRGGLKMNEKFMLVGLAKSCNPRGVCELPVRYLADYIGVGMRQAQRILGKLIHYELISTLDVAPQGRPNDVLRKFILNTTQDPDTWETPGGPDNTSYATLRQVREEYRRRLIQATAEKKLSQPDFQALCKIHLVAIRSKQLDFVSPDAETTNLAFRIKKTLLEIASAASKSEVLRLHMIPQKGYRD